MPPPEVKKNRKSITTRVNPAMNFYPYFLLKYEK
jgi:hypothetical protein